MKYEIVTWLKVLVQSFPQLLKLKRSGSMELEGLLTFMQMSAILCHAVSCLRLTHSMLLLKYILIFYSRLYTVFVCVLFPWNFPTRYVCHLLNFLPPHTCFNHLKIKKENAMNVCRYRSSGLKGCVNLAVDTNVSVHTASIFRPEFLKRKPRFSETLSCTHKSTGRYKPEAWHLYLYGSEKEFCVAMNSVGYSFTNSWLVLNTVTKTKVIT
jgi:hypothetical protein